MKIFTEGRAAYLITPSHTAALFEYTNYPGCFMIILIGAFVSRVALNSMRQERDHYAYDPLTGVYRREHFMQRVESTLKNNPGTELIFLGAFVPVLEHTGLIWKLEITETAFTA